MGSSLVSTLFGGNRQLSRRFFLLVLGCSLAALLLSTALEFWLAYHEGLRRVEENLQLIHDSYLPALETSLFTVDKAQVELLLMGMVRLPGIVSCEVVEETSAGGFRISQTDGETISGDGRKFDLAYKAPNGEKTPLGTLTVYTNVAEFYLMLWKHFAFQILTYSLLMIVSAVVVMVIFQRTVGRHLFKMAAFAQGIDLEHLGTNLQLQREDRHDEIGQVAAALNSMQGRLRQDMAERQAWEEQLKAQRDLIERVMETSPAGIVRADARGQIVYANMQAETILGIHLSTEAGRTYDDPDWRITALNGGPYPKDQLPFFVVRQTLQPVFDVQHAIQWADGQRRLLSINAAPLVDPAGIFEGMVATIEDITERKKLEEHLQQVQKMEAIGNLAGGIAHDFNNILAPIVGFADLLLEDLAPGSTEHEYVKGILEAGTRGKELVKQILAFSRQSEIQMVPVRFQQILKEVLKLCRSTIPADIEILHHIQADCGVIMADATQLHQVAMNLITNAFHAVEASHGRISVELKEIVRGYDESSGNALAPGRYAMLSVADTGCGMEPAVLAKLFTPYFTTKPKGKGTGLGLAVVYGLVQKHRGDIKVYSELGKGSAFHVYLPLIEKIAETSASTPLIKDPTGSERILMVDDEAPIVELERRMLERLGYRTTACTSSISALETFKRGPHAFDLVISDMTMPHMTGDELAQALDAIRPGIPIIICTGFSDRLNPQLVSTVGIKGILMKPIVKSELAQMVRKVLDEVKG
ncbi:MAG: ATP-binding protein [Desulfobacteraceae bacterium]|nr:ATP-binding protein [Desulfobacteraceae bacterium]